MWRHIASNALTFLILAMFLSAGVISWGVNSYKAAGPLDEAICLRVESGSNMRRVSETLESQGAIASGAVFRMGADYSDRAQALKAGSFLVPAGASMADIVNTVTASGASTCGTQIVYTIGVGRTTARVRELDPATDEFVELVRFDPLNDEPPEAYVEARGEQDTEFNIQVVEGTTVWQVMTALNGLDVLEGEVADFPAEGMLAPDQYEVAPGTEVGTLVERMLEAQAERIAAAWAGRADDVPVESPEEALILASIIEKETGLAEERGQVASVFVNRLNRGMKLQTDPTVIYGVTEGEGILGRGLRQSELRRETPWNTYVIEGLPVTPIANPGLASLEAALNPDETSYIFFVADGTGGHAFAETLDEHNRNVARWREIEAEQAASDN